MAKLILLTGGSASGKTTVANSLLEALDGSAVLISQDNFYKAKGSFESNYDEPNAFDFKLQDEIMQKILNNKTIDLPLYNFKNHKREGSVTIEPKEYIIFEGLFSFDSESLVNASLFKIFVDTPSDTRLARRAIRDVYARGRELKDVISRWTKDVQPSYKKYIEKHKKNADIIIPWSAINKKSIKAVITAIKHF